MKKWFNILLLAGVTALWVTACKKDEVRAVLDPQNTPTLNATAKTFVLDSNSASNTAVTFTWDTVKYGYSAVVTYSLEFDLASDSFANPLSVEIGDGIFSKSYTVSALDTLLFQSVGLPANTATAIQVRVKADVKKGGSASGSSSVPSVYSAPVNMTATAYQIVLVYPVIYAPGAYQGWDPPSAQTLASVKSDNSYEGYIYFTTGNYEFKITPAASWATSYGDAGSGKLSTSGGNLTVSSAGYYKVLASTTALTWSVTKTTWGITGSATSAGASAITAMTYDATSKTWSITANLTAGGFLFRTSEDATTKYTVTSGKLVSSTKEISVAAAGSYTIKLDLSQAAGNYAYSIEKN